MNIANLKTPVGTSMLDTSTFSSAERALRDAQKAIRAIVPAVQVASRETMSHPHSRRVVADLYHAIGLAAQAESIIWRLQEELET